MDAKPVPTGKPIPADVAVYSLEEIEAITGFAKRTLLNDCKAGRFEHVKRGNVVGMTVEQIRAVIAASTRPATASPELAAEEAENQAIAGRLARRAARKAA